MKGKILSQTEKKQITRDWVDARRAEIENAFGAKIDALDIPPADKAAIRLDILRFMNTADLYISGIEQKILHPLYHQSQSRRELLTEMANTLGGPIHLLTLGVKLQNYEDKGARPKIAEYSNTIVNAILDESNPAKRMSEYAKRTYHNARLHDEMIHDAMSEGLELRRGQNTHFPEKLEQNQTIWIKLDTPIQPEEATSYDLFSEIARAYDDIEIDMEQDANGMFFVNSYVAGMPPKRDKLKTLIDTIANSTELLKNDQVLTENGVDFSDNEFLDALLPNRHNPGGMFLRLDEINRRRGTQAGKGKSWKNQMLVSMLRRNRLLALHLAAEMKNLGFVRDIEPNAVKQIFLDAIADLSGKYGPYKEYLESNKGAAGRGAIDSVDMLCFTVAPYAVATLATYQDWQNCMHATGMNRHRLRYEIGSGVIHCFGRNSSRPMHNIFNVATYQLHNGRGDTVYRTSSQFYGKSFKDITKTVKDAFNDVFDIPSRVPYGRYQTRGNYLYVEGIEDDELVINDFSDYERALFDDKIFSPEWFLNKIARGMKRDEFIKNYDSIVKICERMRDDVSVGGALQMLIAPWMITHDTEFSEFPRFTNLFVELAKKALDSPEITIDDISFVLTPHDASPFKQKFRDKNIDRVVGALKRLAAGGNMQPSESLNILRYWRLGDWAVGRAAAAPVIAGMRDGSLSEYGFEKLLDADVWAPGQKYGGEAVNFGIVVDGNEDAFLNMANRFPKTASNFVLYAMNRWPAEEIKKYQDLVVAVLKNGKGGFDGLDLLSYKNIDSSERIAKLAKSMARETLEKLTDSSGHANKILRLARYGDGNDSTADFIRENWPLIASKLVAAAKNANIEQLLEIYEFAPDASVSQMILDAVRHKNLSHKQFKELIGMRNGPLAGNPELTVQTLVYFQTYLGHKPNDTRYMPLIWFDSKLKSDLAEYYADKIVRGEKIGGAETIIADSLNQDSLIAPAMPRLLNQHPDQAPRVLDYVTASHQLNEDFVNGLSGDLAILAARKILSDQKANGYHCFEMTYRNLKSEAVRRLPDLADAAAEDCIFQGQTATFKQTMNAIPKSMRRKYQIKYGAKLALEYVRAANAGVLEEVHAAFFKHPSDLEHFDTTKEKIDKPISDKIKSATEKLKTLIMRANAKNASLRAKRSNPANKNRQSRTK